MNKIFIGYDPRQPVSYNVLQQSIFSNSNRPVAITPIIIEQLPMKRCGLTPFTFSRFLVPWMCDFKGWALFLDIDMLVRDDINELFDMADDKYAVMVSKNKLRFEWASAILFNCAHPSNKVLTPEFIDNTQIGLHQIKWVEDESEIGEFDGIWNHLVGYDEPRPDAKLVHYTQGVPAFEITADCEYASEWQEHVKIMCSSLPWEKLMGNSVHAKLMNGKMVPKYKKEPDNRIVVP